MEELELWNLLVAFEEGKIDTCQAHEQILRLFSVSKSFYCQSEIEGEKICNSQCDHCKDYYKPLEQ